MAEPFAFRSLGSVRAAMRAACARPAAWASVWMVELLCAIVPATMWFGWLAATIDHRYAPNELFKDLTTVFRFDQRTELAQLDASTAQAGAVLALVVMLVGAFAAGGWLAIFLSGTEKRGMRPFLAGGARFFGRFLRVMLITIAMLALWSWIVRGAPWDALVLRGAMNVPASDVDKLETLSSERTVWIVRGVQSLLHAIGVALLLVLGDYARTRLALFDTCSSVWAWLESLATLVAHPIRTLRPMVGLFLVEVAFVWALGMLSHTIEARTSNLWDVLLLFGLGQLVLAWRIVLRGARYHAAVGVSRRIVLPIAKPDPWRWGRLAEPDPRPS